MVPGCSVEIKVHTKVLLGPSPLSSNTPPRVQEVKMLEIFDVTATDPSLLVGEPAPRPAPRSRHCSAPSLLRCRNLTIYLSNNIHM